MPNEVFTATIKLDGRAINYAAAPIITSGGTAMAGNTFDHGYAQCIPNGMRAGNVRLGWTAAVDLRPDGSAVVEASAALLTAPVEDDGGCLQAPPPTRSAQWNVTLQLQPGESRTVPGPSGFELIVTRLRNLAD